MSFKTVNLEARQTFFENRLLRRLGAVAIRNARARCKSKTLRRSMEFIQDAPLKGRVFVPHYWAVYFHEGRGGVPRKALKKGRFLVWYKNPRLDPRNAGGYPVRASEQRRLNLSKKEFRRLRKAGQIIVTKSSGPAIGAPFLDRCLTVEETDRIAKEEFDTFVRGLAFREKSTARVRL
jgi:hypothetical protein